MDSDINQNTVSKEQWENIIEKQKQFKGSARQFCQLHQINLRAFYFHRSKLKSGKVKKSKNLTQFIAPSKAIGFTEIRALSDKSLLIRPALGESMATSQVRVQDKTQPDLIQMPDPIWLAQFLKELVR